MFFIMTSALFGMSVIILLLAYSKNKDSYGELAVALIGVPVVIFFGWLWLLSIAFSFATWLGVIYSIISAVIVSYVVIPSLVEKDWSISYRDSRANPETIKFVPKKKPRPEKEVRDLFYKDEDFE